MIVRLDERAASTPVVRTEYGATLYNRIRTAVDRIMPSVYGLQNYLPLDGRLPYGFRAYNTPPTLAPDRQVYSRYALDDMPTVDLGLPWERIRKNQSIG